jgi:hypothetical protein
MILHKCEQGHFYDQDKFAECPYCALEKTVTDEKTQSYSRNIFEETATIVPSSETANRGELS